MKIFAYLPTPQVPRFKRLVLLVILLISLLMALVACSSEETPTPGQNQTQAYETVAALTTQVAQDLATHTTPEVIPTDSGLPTLTPPPAVTDTPPNPTAIASTFTPTPTVSASDCDRAEAGAPIDVTIPDDTELAAGTAFVKTWRLVNIGTCTWNTGYSLVYVSGEKMGGPDVVALGGNVAPGQTVDISVNLTAPATPGTYQGNWMLRNPAGVFFGIGPEGNAYFWVKIVVPGGAGTPSVTPSMTPNGTVTITPTPNGTPSVTPTATSGTTPVVIVNSSAAFPPDGYIDLDTGVTNGGSGNDLAFTSDQSGTHSLSAQGGATFGIFGSQAPSFDNCRSANLGSGALTVESLTAGTYLCYRTDQGHYGWLRVEGFDPASLILSMTILTWQ